MTDPTDLGLADIAPVTLEDDVFEGMLDYAVSEDAHDVDDSLVPADEAPDDAGDVDDIDDVALSDDVADPFAESGGDDDDPDNLGIDEIGVPDDVADDGTDDEGCLSVPGIDFPTGRAERATVTGLDENGEPVTVVGTGLLARCLQHEVGHLDGLLYTDVLTGRWKRAAKKESKARGWNEPGRTWMPGVDEDPFGHEGPGMLDKGQGEAQSEGQGEGQPEGQAE